MDFCLATASPGPRLQVSHTCSSSASLHRVFGSGDCPWPAFVAWLHFGPCLPVAVAACRIYLARFVSILGLCHQLWQYLWHNKCMVTEIDSNGRAVIWCTAQLCRLVLSVHVSAAAELFFVWIHAFVVSDIIVCSAWLWCTQASRIYNTLHLLPFFSQFTQKL